MDQKEGKNWLKVCKKWPTVGKIGRNGSKKGKKKKNLKNG